MLYLGLELGEINRAEGVSFRDDRDQIDPRAQSFHDFNVEWLESVAGGANEIETGVHSQIDLVNTTGLLLLEHI